MKMLANGRLQVCSFNNSHYWVMIGGDSLLFCGMYFFQGNNFDPVFT